MTKLILSTYNDFIFAPSSRHAACRAGSFMRERYRYRASVNAGGDG